MAFVMDMLKWLHSLGEPEAFNTGLTRYHQEAHGLCDGHVKSETFHNLHVWKFFCHRVLPLANPRVWLKERRVTPISWIAGDRKMWSKFQNPAGEEVDFGVIRLDAGEKQRTTKPVDKAENPDIFEHSSNIAEIKEASDGYKNVTLSSTNILSHSAGYLNSSKTVSGEIDGVSSNLQIIENKVDFKNIIIPNKGIQDCDETLKDLSAHKVSAIESEPARGCENKPPISTPTPTHGKNTTLSQYSSPRNDRLQKTHTNKDVDWKDLMMISLLAFDIVFSPISSCVYKGVVQEPAMRSVVLRIETCLKEWFTVHTVKLLLGEDICQGLQHLNITEETGPVLPLVDLHAQNALRRRIVLDRLNRVALMSLVIQLFEVNVLIHLTGWDYENHIS
uniref:Uncharacterized protein n=1 Tax=Timema genevievae TaxID=629358 RepID=A0A7R9K8N1_TIMGE|nr:unnamed protein product [Timema genevievae]